MIDMFLNLKADVSRMSVAAPIVVPADDTIFM
jgi:hypothetical protein